MKCIQDSFQMLRFKTGAKRMQHKYGLALLSTASSATTSGTDRERVFETDLEAQYKVTFLWFCGALSTGQWSRSA